MDGDFMMRCLDSARVYYTLGDAIEDVLRCVQDRQPAGISSDETMLRLLHDEYGYTKSGYATLFQQDPSTLPPNFALYARCPVRDGVAAVSSRACHVLNVIGLAFDTVTQPDYIFFSKNWRARRPFLIAKLKMIFSYCFQCAVDLGVKELVLCPFGAGVGGELYGLGRDDYRQAYIVAFRHALIDALPDLRLSLIDADARPEYRDDMQLVCVAHGYRFVKRGRLVDVLAQPGVLDGALLVNECDPHSFSSASPLGRISAMVYVANARINRRLVTAECLHPVSPGDDAATIAGLAAPSSPRPASEPTSTVVADFPTDLFSFPFKSRSPVPGYPAAMTPLKAHELTDDVLGATWVRFALDRHRTEPTAIACGPTGAGWVTLDAYDRRSAYVRFFLGHEHVAARYDLASDILVLSEATTPTGEVVVDRFRGRVMDEIRHIALQRFGPAQQFDPAEVSGMRRYLQARRAGPYDDAHSVLVNGETYVVWLSATEDAVNIQHASEASSPDRPKPNPKYKISIVGRAGSPVYELREGRKVVAEVNPAYVALFDIVAEDIARTQRQWITLRSGRFVECDPCWARRNLDRLFDVVVRFADQARAIDELRVRFSSPDDDANDKRSSATSEDGARRFVEMIVARATDPRCALLRREDSHFIAKQHDGRLDEAERAIYSGFGRLIALILSSPSTTRPVVLGTVFDLTFYKVLLRTCYRQRGDRPSRAAADPNDDVALQIVRSDSTEVVRYICTLLDAPHTTIAGVTDRSIQYTLFESIRYEDDTIFPGDAFPHEWRVHWTDDLWERARAAIRSRMTRNNLRRVRVVERVAASLGECLRRRHDLFSLLRLDHPAEFRADLWPYAMDERTLRVFEDRDRTILATDVPTLTRGQASLVQASIVRSYLTDRPEVVSSLTDEYGSYWTGGRADANGMDIRYTHWAEGDRAGRASTYYLRFVSASDYDAALNPVFEAVMHRVQGRLTVEAIVSSMRGESARGRHLLAQFLRTSSADRASRFVATVSGFRTITPSQALRVDASHDEGFHFRPWLLQVLVPNNVSAYTQEQFDAALASLF